MFKSTLQLGNQVCIDAVAWCMYCILGYHYLVSFDEHGLNALRSLLLAHVGRGHVYTVDPA